MENIYLLVKFRLQSQNLIEDWKEVSAKIKAEIS
jgi:hypothetical protein